MNTLLKTPSSKTIRRRRKQAFVSLDGLLTVEDWAALRDIKPPYELIDGKLVRKMVTTNKHDWATKKFVRVCDEWSDESGWLFFSQGPGAQMNEVSGFIPDVMGFAPETAIDPDASRNPPPFIAVEVLSRGTASLDRTTKKRTYASAGVQIYVIVNPDKRNAEVYRLQNGAYGAPEKLSGDDIWQPAELSGLSVELARLWM